MNLRIPFFSSLTVLLTAGSAWAQASAAGPTVDVAIGYRGLPDRSPSPQSGIQLSDEALLHVGVGAEVGYDSNVFYKKVDPRGSATTRILPFVELTNAGRTGAAPSNVFFDLGASLTYREYLNTDPAIKSQRAFMPSVYGNLDISKDQALSFGVVEGFARTEDPPYVENQQPITRDVNQASASVRWAPGGGRLAEVLRYTNTLDLFEHDQLKYSNSMSHLLMLDSSWKWLPKTALVLQISQGYTSYLNTDPATGKKKASSLPLHAMAGVRGLITAKLAVNVLVGYANGFYDTIHQSTTGFRGNFSVGAEANYRPTVLTSIGLGYRRDFQNAVLGDFYYVDAVYLNVGQAIAGRLGFGLTARYESRSFQNIPLTPDPDGPVTSRHDNYFQIGANLDYHIRDWTYVGVAYTLMDNNSDYVPPAGNPGAPGPVDYVKHLVFARLGVTY
jgi:hypothetical protein